MLTLHKSLLDAQRIRYERLTGRVETRGELLRLVLDDPAFAWLRRLSSLIVVIDERLDDLEPMDVEGMKSLSDQVTGLLKPDAEGDEFQREYERALQEIPDAVMAHREIRRLLA